MIRIVTFLVTVAVLVLAPVSHAQEASELDVSDAGAFIGTWTVSVESPQGPLAYALDITDVEGKVGATLNNDFLGAATVSDITMSEDALNLKWEADMQGQVVPLTLTLTPDGDGMKAVLDFAGMAQMDGTATR